MQMKTSEELEVDCYVFAWGEWGNQAARWEDELKRYRERVTVIHSGAVTARPHWVELPDSAYYTAQLDRTVELFSGDILFLVMADSRCDDVETLIGRAREVFVEFECGIYSPNVDNTFWRYNDDDLPDLDDGLKLVPMTDCTVWAIHREIVEVYRRIGHPPMRYGWGHDIVMTAIANLQEKGVIRDYGIEVKHRWGRGYNSDQALRELNRYRDFLPDWLQREFDHVWSEGIGMTREAKR